MTCFGNSREDLAEPFGHSLACVLRKSHGCASASYAAAWGQATSALYLCIPAAVVKPKAIAILAPNGDLEKLGKADAGG